MTRMKYLVCFVLNGAAEAWHNATSNLIAKEFGFERLSEKVSPHITLYRPFEQLNTLNIQRVLRTWTSSNVVSGNFNMHDYSQLGERTVCATIQVDEMVMKSVTTLREAIQTIPRIKSEDFTPWIPHASLAMDVKKEEIEKILAYLRPMQKPDFKFWFDAVTLMVRVGKKWEVVEKFALNKK